MMSIAAMGRRQHAYYTDLVYYTKGSRESYLMLGGEPPGQWWGGAVSDLGLGKYVEAGQLQRLFDGKHPTRRGIDLVRNAGTTERRPGWDLTFSAPKTVSLLWANSSRLTQQHIEELHRRACEAALSHLERECGFIRTGKAGAVLHPAKWVVALFEHGTSRALDPQLHTHCLLMNVGLRADGKTAPIASKQFYYAKKAAGALYRAELANLLTRELGVVCEPDRFAFRVAGVPDSLVKASSKRREAIEAEVGRRGMEISSAASFAAATQATRPAKEMVPPRMELFAQWRSQGLEHGYQPQHVRTPRQNHRAVDVQRLLEKTVETITADRAWFTRDMVLSAAVSTLSQTPVGGETLLKEVDRFMQSRHVVEVDTVKGRSRYTTPQVLKEESTLLREASALARAKGVGAARKDIDHIIDHYSRRRSVLWSVLRHHCIQVAREVLKQETVTVDYATHKEQTAWTLSSEQKRALRSLAQERGSLRVLEADAGTGKTKLLGVAREILEKEGIRVIGVAVAGKAARGLQEEAGIPSTSYAMLQTMLHPDPGKRVSHELKQYWRAYLGKPTFKFEPFKLDKNTVLVVDEASMLTNEQLTTLVHDCRKAKSTLVLVGDRDQLQAVGRGGGFAYLSDRFKAAELTQNRRQQDAMDRTVLEHVLSDDFAKVISSLQERGRFHVGKTREEAMEKLVADWLTREQGSRDQCFIFAPTNEQVDSINRECQKARIQNGELNAKHEAQSKYDRLLTGDRVLITFPGRKLGLDNGDTGVITNIAGKGKSAVLSIQLDRGPKIQIPLSQFDEVRLGYAMTTHKAQGVTTQRAYILAGGANQDREQSYVQLSRAKLETHLYVGKADGRRSTSTSRR